VPFALRPECFTEGLIGNDLTATRWFAIEQASGGCAYGGTQASADASLHRHRPLPISRGRRYAAALGDADDVGSELGFYVRADDRGAAEDVDGANA